MTFEKAMSRIKDEFEEAKKLPFIRNPLAYAIYQVWKMADMDGKKIECDCFSLPTMEVHNMTEKDLEIQNLRREIAELRERQKWISVGERMPEVSMSQKDRVLVNVAPSKCYETDKGGIDTDRTIDGKTFQRWGYRVTHWMPLPDVPEVE